MVSSIGSSGASAMMQMHRPDPTQMASKLFAKLDTKNQGYLEKSDLQSAFDKLSGSSSSASTSSVDDVFKQLDGNSDGKVTQDELTTSLKNLAAQLDSQFEKARMSGAMNGASGMPPPPPPSGGNDAGFTKDELQSQLDQVGSTDSKHSSLLSNIVANFDQADTDGDGKVSMKEAMAFEQSQKSSTTSTADATASSSTASNSDLSVMMKIMQLVRAYGVSGQDNAAGSLSVTA